MVNRRAHPRSFFSKEEKERILKAIRQAERETSGEIRVYLEHQPVPNVLEHTKKIFSKLGMTKTKQRNAILIYLSLRGRQLAVIGDEGIHQKVGDDFWRKAVSEIERHFSREDFTEGLEAGIHLMGSQLKKHFPRGRGDINELPDEISG